MTPATGKKNPDTYMVSGYELGRQMGSPEFMSLSSLGKYVNRDAGKYHFWMEKIHKGLVIPKMSAEEQRNPAVEADTHILLIFVKVNRLFLLCQYTFKMTHYITILSRS